MSKATLKSVSEKMKDVDLCMFTTVTARGATASRPMSNNADVAYDGTSYFFTYKKSRVAKDITKNNNVSLSYQGSKLLSKSFIAISGKARLIDDKEVMSEHWTKDLEIWFKDGLETRGIVMIEVAARYIKYWSNTEEGELEIKRRNAKSES